MKLKRKSKCFFKDSKSPDNQMEYFPGTDVFVTPIVILDKYIIFKMKDFSFFDNSIFYSERENFYESE